MILDPIIMENKQYKRDLIIMSPPVRVGRHIVFPLRLSVCGSDCPSQNRVRSIT